MTQTELAKLLGMSGGYFWKIYNGYAKPSRRMVDRIMPYTGKAFSWWKAARTSQIQKLFDKIMNTEAN